MASEKINVQAYMANENLHVKTDNGVVYFTVHALVNQKDGIQIPVMFKSGFYLNADMTVVKNTIVNALKSLYATAESIRLISGDEYSEFCYQHPECKPQTKTNYKKFIDAI